MLITEETSVAVRIKRFRESIAPDLYSLSDFLPWTDIERQLETSRDDIRLLQTLIDQSHGSNEELHSALLNRHSILRIIRELLSATPEAVGFVDGRELPDRVPSHANDVLRLSGLLADLGIWRILAPGTSVEALARIALIATDSRRRRIRRTSAIQDRVRKLVESSIKDASDRTATPLRLFRAMESPPGARSAEFVVGLDELPLVAIATVFQAQSGGRQQRDLSLTYPSLQARLDSIPMSLFLIADGRGIAETPDRVLTSLFESMAACMSVREAESGVLADALTDAVERRGLRKAASAPLTKIIESTLESRPEVMAEALPGSTDSGRFALADYLQQKSDLALQLSALGDSLRWQRPEEVAKGNQITSRFDPTMALQLFSDLMDPSGVLGDTRSVNSLRYRSLLLPPDTILPNKLLAVATAFPPNLQVMYKVSQLALQETPEPHIVALLVPDAFGLGATARQAVPPTLASTITVLPATKLRDLARRRESPRDGFVKEMLEQSDLTKVSPFVLSSVTPERMFFGREAEEAILVSTLATNSVAILGGRRIGKTSLMRHVHRALEDAGFLAFFGDCQTVRDWSGFASLAERRWNAQLPHEFQPEYVFDLIEKLNDSSGRKIVLLLDEVDQLLDWDELQRETEVSEAFFKACRTISQEGHAQFVFSGERVIARKLWDPHSPHWNFCRPLPLRQLTRDAATQLLLSPISSLQIQVPEKDTFGQTSWEITSGHPQIVQFLGDKLIRLLNERRGDERTRLLVDDIRRISQSFEYREHYLETYWGQATQLERILSLFTALEPSSPADLDEALLSRGVTASESDIAMGMRMLEMYGILSQTESGYQLHAEWFPEALQSFGGAQETLDRLFRDL